MLLKASAVLIQAGLVGLPCLACLGRLGWAGLGWLEGGAGLADWAGRAGWAGLPWALLGSPGFPLLLCGFPRPSLLAVVRIVFAIVRRSRMKCPHDIGRDSWVWGEQETL